MSKEEAILGDFHYPTTDKHPNDSIGNQQVFDQGYQVGSIEYFPNFERQTLDLKLFNRHGEEVGDL